MDTLLLGTLAILLLQLTMAILAIQAIPPTLDILLLPIPTLTRLQLHPQGATTPPALAAARGAE